MAAQPPAQELGALFARVSGLLLSRETVDTVLRLITSVALETFPGSRGAGLTLLDEHGERVTAAATDPVVEAVDEIQYRLGQGPCLDAWQQRTLVRADDLRTEQRWPDWSPQAAHYGMRAVLSAPLVTEAQALGAIKVYATQPDTYGRREERLLPMFATQAAILLTHMRTAKDAEHVSDSLAEALRTRDVLSIARGIVMQRDGVDERAAFLALVESAERQRVTVRQAAEELIRTAPRRRR